MSQLHAHIGEWLGVPLPQTERDVLELVERRLPPSAVDRLLALGFSRAEADEIVIPGRTLQHRRSRSENLTIDESDRLLRLLRVLSMAESVYDSRELGLAWLRHVNPRLGDRKPLALTGTDAGSRLVEELLGQIDEGMFI